MNLSINVSESDRGFSAMAEAHDPGVYLKVREREGRIYSDEVVARLPEVPAGHQHYDEWRMRASSARRLTAYFGQAVRPLRILELGCGNGWLSAQMARLSGCRVWGMDTNLVELPQAARVFADERLCFVEADIYRPAFAEGSFDAVVIASAIQYFGDLPRLLSGLLRLVKPGGEVHIIDSPLYEEAKVSEARRRTEQYYERLGFAEMAARYHHHSVGELNGLEATWLYDPRAFSARLRRRIRGDESPFPWLVLRSRR